MRTILLSLAMALACTAALGQTSGADSAPVTSAAPSKAARVVLISSVEAEYPEEARAAGHQGVVILSGVVLAGGTLTSPAVKVSSGSKELDQAALGAFSQWKFNPGLDERGVPKDTRIAMPYAFYKDSFDDPARAINKKTCADFAADVRWFDLTFPGHKRSEMHIYELTLGAFWGVSLMPGFPNADRVDGRLKNYEAIFQATFEDCAKHPAANFMTTIKRRVF
ncbi:MAG: energy transducer TonB [Caulobacter sp.]|nr:energy transducer TonB [Caulobacter sp.]